MLVALTASAASWNAGDLKGHLSIYDDSVTVMTKTGPRPSVAAIEASFSAAYFKDGKPKQLLSFEQVSIRFLSSESALMTGRFELAGGGLPDQSGWFSLVWVHTAAGWRVVHDHTS
jgi:ketosteroid isomerase-like protein